MATVTIPLEIQLPAFPDQLFISALKPATLDDAYGCTGFKVSCATLTEHTIEQVINEWGIGFRDHCKRLRAEQASKPQIR